MGSISGPIALQVIVTGGGIGGLSAAIALRRAGHHVTVYERFPEDSDAGAGIVVCANAARVLKQWGLDLEAVGMSTYMVGYILQGTTLEVLDIPYGEGSKVNTQEENGEAQHPTTRHDLRNLLRKEADKNVLGQGTIKFRYATEVVDYDADGPSVKFADSTWVDADLVVACDGIRSRAAKVICGGENPAMATGRSAFRLLIPSERLAAVREKYKDEHIVRDKFDTEKGNIWFARDHEQRLVVWWTTRFGQIHAMDVIVPDDHRFMSTEDWTAKCDKNILHQEFAQWHPLFRDVFEAAEGDPMLWKICNREPLQTLHRGKLCMLGDALHPMPPFRAQGGSQSIEDAGALEMVLSNLGDRSELTDRLKLLDELRVPRYACAQMISSVRQDEPNMEERYVEVMHDCRRFFKGKDQSHLENRHTFQTWLMSYDVREAARQTVEASRAL